MTPTKPIHRLALAAVLSTALIAGPGAAQAHKRSFPATITAAAKNKNFFDGKVTTVPRCLANRSVSVFSSAGVLLGTDATDAQGIWQAQSGPDITPGAYYAVLKPRRLLRNKRHRHICRGARIDFQAT